jgi:hypothetical protein
MVLTIQALLFMLGLILIGKTQSRLGGNIFLPIKRRSKIGCATWSYVTMSGYLLP